MQPSPPSTFKTFIFPNRNSVPIEQTLRSLLSRPLETALLYLSMNVALLGLSECNHTVFVFCDWLISLSIVSSGSSMCSLCQNPFLLSAECHSILCVSTAGLSSLFTW